MTTRPRFMARFDRIPKRIKDGLVAPSIFLILTLLVFNTGLFDSTKVIGSDFGGDLPAQFLPWRKFGFDELRHGNLALWNPHIYGGAPYFGGFQSALLYPPNWLHLILPVGMAINWINALHVFAAGYFTNLWCRNRGLGVASSVLAGVMFMFSGAFFLRIYAGHLPHLAAMVWAPLLFLSIDKLIDGAVTKGVLLGIPVMAMFLLAGHPQYVYYTGIVAAIYVTLNLLRFKRISGGLAGCAILVLGGAAIAAIQLLAGVDANSESVRSSGMGYDFIANMSFPPENVLTAIAPNVFGPLPTEKITFDEIVVKTDAYFGRGILWEASLFVSVAGLILAIHGMFVRPFNKSRGLTALIVVCFAFALGSHTPLHRFLYDHLPGFSWFRETAKFGYLITLFLSLFAAYGFDSLWRTKRVPNFILGIAALLLVMSLSLAISIHSSAGAGHGGTWDHLLRRAYEAGGGSNLDAGYLDDEKFVVNSGRIAADALFGSSIVLGAIIAVLLVARFRFRAVLFLIPIATIELFINANSTLTRIDSELFLPQSWNDLIKSRPENSRIIGIGNENMGMWFGYNDVWGYDPLVQKRYAELLYFSQANNPDDASQHLTFGKTHFNIFPLLRISGVFRDDTNEPMIPTPKPMSIAQLIPSAKVLRNRDEIFETLDPNSFEPRDLVLLEREPSIKLARLKEPGSVELIGQSTDHLELTVDAPGNAMLLITNAYSRGWKARSIGPAIQPGYEVIPADWAFQAIPLVAGRHHLWIEYRPRAFVIGKWISIFACVIYLGAVIWYWRPLKLDETKSHVSAS